MSVCQGLMKVLMQVGARLRHPLTSYSSSKLTDGYSGRSRQVSKTESDQITLSISVSFQPLPVGGRITHFWGNLTDCHEAPPQNKVLRL